MRQLNERLGMGHTFVHDRYGSKEAFWRAVMDAAMQTSNRGYELRFRDGDHLMAFFLFHRRGFRRPGRAAR